MVGDGEEAAGLKMLAEKTLQSPIDPRHMRYCPTMDLLAIAMADGQVHVFRTNGQKVFGISGKETPGDIADMIWKPDGEFATAESFIATGEAEELQLVLFDLRLISSAGRYLSLLASKVTELHNLLRYVDQNQEHIFAEIKATQDLPSRFMRNIDESLSEKSDSTWVQAAYHLVATGHCYPEVKEWLVDEVGERGHKRWDKAVTAGYESIRRLTHENLLPALDRLSVLVSRLRGLSRFQHPDFLLGLSTLELDNIVDSIRCIQLQAHSLLKCAILEAKQFSAFSTWLRHEIEKQATDPTSASAQEITEKDVIFDYAAILEYIQGAMTASQMFAFSGSQSESTSRWDLNAEGVLFELYKSQIKTEARSSAPQRRLPGLSGLIQHLHEQCDSLFDRVSESQRRNVQVGTPTYLGAGSSACVDMRMVTEVFLVYSRLSTGYANELPAVSITEKDVSLNSRRGSKAIIGVALNLVELI
ncbi:MAG: hypothetical protein LQ346_002636 [Caloplaca aetnensis]|nr:MAG: hypothetical protein LQ346_002636 [Caloplaca aetnensis]